MTEHLLKVEQRTYYLLPVTLLVIAVTVFLRLAYNPHNHLEANNVGRCNFRLASTASPKGQVLPLHRAQLTNARCVRDSTRWNVGAILAWDFKHKDIRPKLAKG